MAVTITEAMFFDFKVLSLIERPCRLRMLAIVAMVKPFFRSSPVPEGRPQDRNRPAGCPVRRRWAEMSLILAARRGTG